MGTGAMPIQDDSGEKVKILGGDSTGHCDKKSSHEHCLIPNSYRDTAVWIYKYKNSMNDNKEREIMYINQQDAQNSCD